MSRPRKASFLYGVRQGDLVACESCPASVPIGDMCVVQPDDSAFDEWWCPACVVAGCPLVTVPVGIQRLGGVKT